MRGDAGKHVKAIVELIFGAAHHYTAGLEEKYGEHPDKHQQIPGFLRRYGESVRLKQAQVEVYGNPAHGVWGL